MSIRSELTRLADAEYRAFQSRLMPTVPLERIIGVRMPALRGLAKETRGSEDANAFMRALPHDFYDEDNLHALLINWIDDFDAAVAALNAFLPYVDNWATCDALRPKAFRSCPPGLIPQIEAWLATENAYTVRFAIDTLMTEYLREAFRPEYMRLVSLARPDEYYVNMAAAWYFATALAHQYDAAIVYIEENRLLPWTHNKAIQKAVESRRVSDEHKAYLRTLRRKAEPARVTPA